MVKLRLVAKESDISVVGRVLNHSHLDFENMCREMLCKEYNKTSPNTNLIDILSDSIRLSRECCDIYRAGGKIVRNLEKLGYKVNTDQSLRKIC